MSAFSQEAVYRASRLYLEQCRPAELPIFEVFWAAAKESLAELNAGGRRVFNGVFGGLAAGGDIRSAEDWASPYLLTMLAAVCARWPPGTKPPPSRTSVQELLVAVARRHGAPPTFGDAVTPFALQMYQLRVGSPPDRDIDDYFVISSNVEAQPRELSLDAASALVGVAKTSNWQKANCDVVIRLHPDATSDGGAYGVEFRHLPPTETSFLVALLEARGRLRISELTDVMYGEAMSAQRSRDRVKKARTRVVGTVGQSLGAAIRAEDNGSVWSIDPSVRFCILRHAFRSVT